MRLLFVEDDPMIGAAILIRERRPSADDEENREAQA